MYNSFRFFYFHNPKNLKIMSTSLKQPRALPEQAEKWINLFNDFFKERIDPGIVYIFSTQSLEAAKKVVSNQKFSEIKGFCHKIILLSEPLGEFIPSEDLDSTEFHASVIFNDIGDEVCFSSQAILCGFEGDFVVFEVNPSGADRVLFVLKFQNFSEEEKKWIATEVENMNFRCASCVSNSKQAKHEHFGTPKEIITALGSR